MFIYRVYVVITYVYYEFITYKLITIITFCYRQRGMEIQMNMLRLEFNSS